MEVGKGSKDVRGSGTWVQRIGAVAMTMLFIGVFQHSPMQLRESIHDHQRRQTDLPGVCSASICITNRTAACFTTGISTYQCGVRFFV